MIRMRWITPIRVYYKKTSRCTRKAHSSPRNMINKWDLATRRGNCSSQGLLDFYFSLSSQTLLRPACTCSLPSNLLYHPLSSLPNPHQRSQEGGTEPLLFASFAIRLFSRTAAFAFFFLLFVNLHFFLLFLVE